MAHRLWMNGALFLFYDCCVVRRKYNMQNYTTIIGVLTMSTHGASQRECQARYHIGSST